MIRVFVDPIPKLGIAMARTAHALKMTAPEGVTIVDSPLNADLQVLHAVAPDVLRHLQAPKYAVMMHCLDYMADPQGNGDNIPIERGQDREPWRAVWSDAQMVWSYYPLHEREFTWGGLAALKADGTVDMSNPLQAPAFYGAPLGADASVFTKSIQKREHGILTTGYVSGQYAEAIEEVAIACHRAGKTTMHLGPSSVGGMTAKVPGWQAVSGISEQQLAALYGSVQYVSGLRHGEGFELPIIEGLLCGARPICFDLPCYRLWFDKHAIFVPECHGEELIERLAIILKRPPRPVLPEERAVVARMFDWQAIGAGFWQVLLKAIGEHIVLKDNGGTMPTPSREDYALRDDARSGSIQPPVGKAAFPRVLAANPAKKPVLLWVGDSPTTAWTGFGKASKYILHELSSRFDVVAVGTTHDGAPYSRKEIPYDVYPLNYGIGKVVSQRKPSIAIIQHDPWQIPSFMRAVGNIPTMAVMPIDGKNCNCSYLNGLSLAVWWTEWAAKEARENGYGGLSTVIPLGVDLNIYKPMTTGDARKAIGLPLPDDAFVVGYIARNQPRKRLDLAVRHFGEWIKSKNVQDAYLYIQTAPTGETAYDVSELIRYERISNRFIPVESDLRGAITEEKMCAVYNAIDVFWSTSQGEGFGMPALEAMACGTPCILPDWAAYGDWALPAARLVKIADTAATINFAKPASGVKIAVLGATPDRADNVEALDKMYRDQYYRDVLTKKSLALAGEDRFRWETIGQQFIDAATSVLDGPMVMRR